MSDTPAATRGGHSFAIATVAIDGVTPFPLIVDTRDQYIGPMLLERGVWEAQQSLLLSRTLRAGWRVIDVGANLGYYTLLAAHRVGPSGEVWAFEPEPANFRLLAANVALNGCAQVALMQAAAGAHRATLPLALAPHNFGDHRLALAPGANGSARVTVPVEVVRLDDCFPDQAVHFVKIDTQGAELEVLRGMQALIGRNRERLLLQLEFSPGLLIAAGAGVAHFVELLETLGARAVTFRGEGSTVLLTVERSIAEACTRLAAELASWPEPDASQDLFVCFSEEAARLHFGG